HPPVGARGAEGEPREVRRVTDLLGVADLAVEAPVGGDEHRHRGHRLLEAMPVHDLHPLQAEVRWVSREPGGREEQGQGDRQGRANHDASRVGSGIRLPEGPARKRGGQFNRACVPGARNRAAQYLLRMEELIERLGLLPHPEGGWYRETYRAARTLPGTSRSVCTAILYLVRAGERSRLHRIDSDELWHFYRG